jgi:hypothetical protein
MIACGGSGIRRKLREAIAAIVRDRLATMANRGNRRKLMPLTPAAWNTNSGESVVNLTIISASKRISNWIAHNPTTGAWPMDYLLSRFNSTELLILIGMTGGFFCWFTCIVGKHWLKIRQLEIKKDMLERGMSADEITAVLNAGAKK